MDWKKVVQGIEIKEEMKEELLYQCKRNRHVPNLLFRYSKIAAAAAAVFVCLAGSVTVYAAVNAYQARLDAMDDKEITEHYDFAQIGTADADSWSRPLTESERTRMDELKIIFEQGERFPEGEIDTTGEAGDFYYEAEIRTFHLPKEELTDEQLLEILDLWAKLDYSLQKKNEELGITAQDTEMNTGTIEEVTEDSPAYVRGKEVLESIYELDTETMEMEIRYVENKREEGKGIYVVIYKNEEESYQAVFHVNHEIMEQVPDRIGYYWDASANIEKAEQTVNSNIPTTEKMEMFCRKGQKIVTDVMGAEGTVTRVYCSVNESYPDTVYIVVEMENMDRYELTFGVEMDKLLEMKIYDHEEFANFELFSEDEITFEME